MALDLQSTSASSGALAANPALIELDPFIGRWSVEIIWSEQTHELVGGPRSVRVPASFEWTNDGGFVVHATGREGAPVARWMIGRDYTSGAGRQKRAVRYVPLNLCRG